MTRLQWEESPPRWEISPSRDLCRSGPWRQRGLACKLIRMADAASRKHTEGSPTSSPRLARRRNRGRIAGAVRRLALLHPAASARLEAARRTARKMPRGSDAVCTVEVDPRWVAASRASRPSAMWSCCTGWTRRGATSCCRRRAITPSSAAPSRCVRRCGPIRLRVSVARLIGIDGNKLSVVGARLPRRHAAARHQAVFRVDRFGPDARSAGTPAASAELSEQRRHLADPDHAEIDGPSATRSGSAKRASRRSRSAGPSS